MSILKNTDPYPRKNLSFLTNKKLGLAIAFLLNSILAFSQEVTVIEFFKDSNIQQYKGVEWHLSKKFIPSNKYSKAYLRIDLGCATYGCCAWDYLYQGFITKGSDTSEKSRIEIARLITPYSSFMRKNRQGYDSLWSHPYIYDVTDYLTYFEGDATYMAHTGGWDDKGKFGFKHTVSLILVHGENFNKVDQVLPHLKGAYRYHDSSQFEEFLKPYSFEANDLTKTYKYRMIFTGHDQQGEFSPINSYLRINDSLVSLKRLWKTDCDQNAIQPQSGTWIFSRCNWCPGEKVKEIEWNISPYIKPGVNKIDFVLGKIESDDSIIRANYLISSQIIRYENLPPYNAELVDVVSPNKDPRYKTYNPTSSNVNVLVRNTGNFPIRNLHFEYFTSLGEFRKFSWAGFIAPFHDTMITLPMIWTSADFGSNQFFVRMIRSTQNRPIDFDQKLVSFTSPPLYRVDKLRFELELPKDSTISVFHIYDQKDSLIFQDSISSLKGFYVIEKKYLSGNYRLELLDYEPKFLCGDGLGFWYSSRVHGKKVGSFKILNGDNNTLLKAFNPDFGRKISLSFRLGSNP